jgi:molybdate transport system permease protein
VFEWHPVYLSTIVATAASLLVVIAGTLLARFMTQRSFPGQDFVDGLLLLPLVLPPVVTGFVLLVLVGNNGPVGRVLNDYFHTQLVFTPYAAILASAVVAFPLMYQSARASMQSLDTRLEDAARSLGGSEWRVFFTVTLPLCWPDWWREQCFRLHVRWANLARQSWWRVTFPASRQPFRWPSILQRKAAT